MRRERQRSCSLWRDRQDDAFALGRQAAVGDFQADVVAADVGGGSGTLTRKVAHRGQVVGRELTRNPPLPPPEYSFSTREQKAPHFPPNSIPPKIHKIQGQKHGYLVPANIGQAFQV